MYKESIFLIGPMGAGKSTVGRVLAEKLGYDFVDSDHVIEAITGTTIPTIFDIEGEEGFRVRETQAIDALTQQADTVLATGGGAVMREENRKYLRSRGFVVYLKSSVDSLLQRTRHDTNRPLLQTSDPRGVMLALIEQREPLYIDVADLVIETEQMAVHRVVKQIIDELKKQQIVGGVD